MENTELKHILIAYKSTNIGLQQAHDEILRLYNVVGRSKVELCECNYPLIRTGTKERPEYCGNCEKDI